MASTDKSGALLQRPAVDLRAALVARELSPVELVEATAERIEALQPSLNAYVTLCLDAARDAARRAERAYADGTARPLEGLPIAVKDFFDTAGVRTTVGSSIFAERVPEADAEAVRRVRAAGAIVVGKSATHEFGWGITTDSASFGPTHNPWALDRVAGGSSGGSAVALATGQAALAIGSDTGGSIRIPAAFCGVVGMKPTWGRVSCDGAFPLAPSLDHPGAMARTPADAALLLDVLVGARTAIDGPGTESLRGTRVGLCPDLELIDLPADLRRARDDAEATLRQLGVQVREVRMPHADRILPTFATIQQAEALHTHRRAGLYPARADEYGADVLGRLRGAEAVGLDDLLDALDERRAIARRFATLFEEVDVLLTPVAGASPVPIGETLAVGADGTEAPLRDLVMPFTVPQDLVGLPACAVRAGFDALGVPVGVQLTGALGADRDVLEVAQALFAATPDVQGPWPDLASVPVAVPERMP